MEKLAAFREDNPAKFYPLCAAVAILAVLIGVLIFLLVKEKTEAPETEAEAEEEQWEEPAADASYDASAGVIDAEVYEGTVLPEGEDAGVEYVNETLFLGDSNTYRYMMYADEETGEAFTSTANNIGVVSMSVGQIPTLKCEQFVGDSNSYTMVEAVAMLKPRRIIIGFGSNNLSGTSTDATKFIETYEEGLAAIHESWPYADIIVSSIPPLDKQRDNTNLNQIQVDAYNAAIVDMCEENGYKYLNTAEVLKDETTGWAKTDYTLSDGVHLSKTAVTEVFHYIRTHPYLTEDRRPADLGKIPTPSGVIPNLISSDPIAVRGAKYPIEVGVEGEGNAYAGASSAKAGTSVSLTATPADGWYFDYWTCSAGSVSGGSSATLSMPSTCDANGVYVVAHFSQGSSTQSIECLHINQEITRTKEPTCVAGIDHHYCYDCGTEWDTEVEAVQAHNFSGGYCTVCGYQDPNYVLPTVPPVATPTQCPHANLTRTRTVEPGCEQAGTDHVRCNDCGAEWDETVAAIGHDFQNGICTRCGAYSQS